MELCRSRNNGSKSLFFESIKKIKDEFDINKITIVNGQAGDFITGNHLPTFEESEYLRGADIAQFGKHFQLNMKINKDKIQIQKYKMQNLEQLKLKKEKYYHYKRQQNIWNFGNGKKDDKESTNMQKVYEFFNINWNYLYGIKNIYPWVHQSYENRYGRNLFIKYLVETDKYNVFKHNAEQLPKWLTTNTYISKLEK